MPSVDPPSNCVPAAWEHYWASVADLPATLFHYTSAAAAASIITSRQMWATDLLFTNDPTELTYAAEVIGAALDDVIADVGNDAGRRAWLESFRRLAHYRVRENSWYAISFCSHGDLLSQWRSYADSGGGFALGFSRDSLSSLRAWVLPIEYDYRQQLRLIREIVDMHVQELAHHRDVDHESAREDYIRTSNSLLFLLSLFLFRFKHEAFQEEREYRLAFPVVGGTTLDGQRVKFRAIGASVKPYVEVSFGNVDLAEVRYGPTTNAALTERWLRLALDGGGWRRASVQPSKVPMR